MGIELEGLELLPLSELYPRKNVTPASGWHPPMSVDHTTTQTTTTPTQ